MAANAAANSAADPASAGMADASALVIPVGETARDAAGPVNAGRADASAPVIPAGGTANDAAGRGSVEMATVNVLEIPVGEIVNDADSPDSVGTGTASVHETPVDEIVNVVGSLDSAGMAIVNALATPVGETVSDAAFQENAEMVDASALGIDAETVVPAARAAMTAGVADAGEGEIIEARMLWPTPEHAATFMEFGSGASLQGLRLENRKSLLGAFTPCPLVFVATWPPVAIPRETNWLYGPTGFKGGIQIIPILSWIVLMVPTVHYMNDVPANPSSKDDIISPAPVPGYAGKT